MAWICRAHQLPLLHLDESRALYARAHRPDTQNPAGEPEFVAGGMMGDDFCIDQNAGVAS